MTKEIYTTCKAKAIYPHLRTPEVYEGQDLGYTIKIIPSVEDAQKLEEFLRKELTKAASLPEFVRKNLDETDSFIGMSETAEGDKCFKFKTKSTYETKAGEVRNRVVPIYDATGKPLPKNIDIGHGSIVRVAYSIHPYYKSKKSKGITLYLAAVQVIELVERGERSAESFGFAVEEGYVAPEGNIENDIPFPVDEGADF